MKNWNVKVDIDGLEHEATISADSIECNPDKLIGQEMDFEIPYREDVCYHWHNEDTGMMKVTAKLIMVLHPTEELEDYYG